CMVGDGESETGPLATSWHSNKFLNPVTDGAVIPVLHLNGYKINNPTILARISHEELESLFIGYGYTPLFVEGSDRESMHQAMAATLEHCVLEIRKIQSKARSAGMAFRPRWPMIILRTPKGWTAPRKVDEHYLEGFWRAHQIPITDVVANPEHLAVLEQWMRSYEPEKLFDAEGRLTAELKALAPKGARRMSANPIANGGLVRKPLDMPDFRQSGVNVDKPGVTRAGNVPTLGNYLRDVMRQNMHNFRVFGPDETQSNQLQALYEVCKKVWLGEYFPEDLDGGELGPDGRVMEMLSEHTVEGWLEGYILSGRHGLINSYEPFIHVVDSMYNQHAKWLEKCSKLSWRAPISSLNLLITALVWRQDHNGFTHQDPGFLDVVANKSPAVTRIYLPPDANTLLSVADHCLKSVNYVNVIVADKKVHLQYLDMDAAIAHCTKGLGIWNWASNDQGVKPDVVMASCGDVPTMEALAAAALLRQYLPDVKIRFVNVVDLFKLVPNTEHSHGLTDREFEEVFAPDTPVVFNFHSYPWLIHRLTYRRPGQHNIHVRGYKEQGNINTPLELAIRNQTDRFSLAIDAIDRMPRFQVTGAGARETLRNRQIACQQHAYEFGVDRPEDSNWTWPY
ncbi:MAG: phosphoketolase family protein, partial [Phycisphaerae bacterium]|nr:phosphoketolase family protein [Phycisphaerae bacterium]